MRPVIPAEYSVFPSQQAERHASAEPLDGGLRRAAARVGQPVSGGLAALEAFQLAGHLHDAGIWLGVGARGAGPLSRALRRPRGHVPGKAGQEAASVAVRLGLDRSRCACDAELATCRPGHGQSR